MCKQIKFDLELAGKKVRSISDLKDNFNINDLLFYFEEEILDRWLELNPKENQILIERVKEFRKKVSAEHGEERPVKIISGLAKDVFELAEFEEKEIRLRLRRNNYRSDKPGEITNSEQRTLESFCQEYQELTSRIRDLAKSDQVREFPFANYLLNSGVSQKIKLKDPALADLKNEIEKIEEFLPLFQLDLPNLFKDLLREQLIAIFYLLANSSLKKAIFANENTKNALLQNPPLHTQRLVFEEYNKLIAEKPFKILKVLKDSGGTISQPVLIINLPKDILITSGEKEGENPRDYQAAELNGHYQIFRELNYQNVSTKNDAELIYLEV